MRSQGQSGVGKSALFNRIVRQRIAIVHEESGVTRDRLVMEVNWHDERFELIDTGGLGMMDGAGSPDVIEEGIRKQVEVAVQDAAAVVLVGDITAGCMPLDEEVARILRDSAAAEDIVQEEAVEGMNRTIIAMHQAAAVARPIHHHH